MNLYGVSTDINFVLQIFMFFYKFVIILKKLFIS
jgi:hypothetical protein